MCRSGAHLAHRDDDPIWTIVQSHAAWEHACKAHGRLVGEASNRFGWFLKRNSLLQPPHLGLECAAQLWGVGNFGLGPHEPQSPGAASGSDACVA